MKLRLLMAAASAVLVLAPRTASAQEMQSPQAAGLSSSAMMQRNANESAQATTDISFGEPAGGMDAGAQPVQNVSYGGVAAGQSEAGGRQSQRCASSGPQCSVYFGQ
ncbi:hypothetical protein P0D71_01545 [Paraburkholderia sp. RL17-383-BIF-A]|jgi:hypothetical protein|uniref:hypothetical protein n=1 Tax=Paraburkholderia sp. RL17-383-BIF-A TaxID=3031631 RepID=UPI0038BC045D